MILPQAFALSSEPGHFPDAFLGCCFTGLAAIELEQQLALGGSSAAADGCADGEGGEEPALVAVAAVGVNKEVMELESRVRFPEG